MPVALTMKAFGQAILMFIYGYLCDVDNVNGIDFCEFGWVCTPTCFCGDGLRVLRVAAVYCATSSAAASARHPMSTFLYRTLCLCSGLFFFCAIMDHMYHPKAVTLCCEHDVQLRHLKVMG